MAALATPRTEGPLLVSQSLEISGSVSNDTIVERNCSLYIGGDLLGSLTVESGAQVIVEGTIGGKIVNKGGRLVVNNRGIAACVGLDGPPEAEACGVLRVSLAALAANWDLITQGNEAECAAVLSCNAYGLGIARIAGTLTRLGCNTFFVSDIPEARQVRRFSPAATIYVLNGFYPGSAPAFAEINARPVINSAIELAEWDAAVAGPQWTGGYALQVDTGATRRGFAIPEAAALAPRIRSANNGIRLLMSRLDDPATSNESQRTRQIASFRELSRLFHGVPASLAASSGLFNPKARFDMVRAGSALFGINPTPPAAKAMRPVVELRTRILHIRALAAGETLGDQLHFTAKRATKVALISVGRADGFPSPVAANDRKLQVIIGGHRCPVIGRPSSDLAAVDITSLPDPSAARRDKPVTLIGDGIGIEEIAAATQQAGREVLACLGARFHRVYHVN